MTLKECYDAMGGGYEDAIGRIRREASLEKFVLKFPEDGSYHDLMDGLAACDYDKAFRGAHSLKGVAGNLGFDRLTASSTVLCERLRSGYDGTVPDLAGQVEADYGVTLSAILQYRAERAAEGGA